MKDYDFLKHRKRQSTLLLGDRKHLLHEVRKDLLGLILRCDFSNLPLAYVFYKYL